VGGGGDRGQFFDPSVFGRGRGKVLRFGGKVRVSKPPPTAPVIMPKVKHLSISGLGFPFKVLACLAALLNLFIHLSKVISWCDTILYIIHILFKKVIICFDLLSFILKSPTKVRCNSKRFDSFKGY